MSRPKPIVIMDYVNPKNYISEQVLKASAIYAVFHNGQPINLRSINAFIDLKGAKYKKTAFPNAGHAFNLAEKLNKLFKTDTFEVYKLTVGEKVLEHEDE